MEEFFAIWGDWTWWIVAVGLGALELVIPGVFLIWLAGAAAIVGALGLVVSLPWQWEVGLFGLLSVISAYAGYRLSNSTDDATDSPLLNQRAESYVGRTFVVAEAIENGRGKVHVGDTLWQAAGADFTVGTSVKVVSVAGTVLSVEAA